MNLAAVVLSLISVTGIHSQHPPVDTAYLIDSLATVRETPTAGARIVTTVRPLRVVALYEAREGWVYIGVPQGKDKPYIEGWTKGSKENILRLTLFESMVRLVQLEREAQWTMAVKADIVRGRARVGFTASQVAMALGEPLRKTSKETSAGKSEVWLYPSQSVAFRSGRVTSIETIE